MCAVAAVRESSLATETRLQEAPQVPKVLFDEGHRQQFLVGREGDLDLSRLARVFRDNGFEVRSHAGAMTSEALRNVDVLVVSGPFAPFTAAESDAVVAFVEGGGRLCVMLHIASPVAELLHRLGVSVSNAAVHETEAVLGGKDLDFTLTRLHAHPITNGLSGYRVFGGWALLPRGDGVRAIAETGPQAWVDLDGDGRRTEADAAQTFALAVAGRRGSGEFVVFGDDATFQNHFFDGDNEALGRNLAAWAKAKRIDVTRARW
jgi:hypothetical protein